MRHLVMAPNWRPVGSSYLFNLLDKIILDNPATQFLLRHAFGSGLLKPKSRSLGIVLVLVVVLVLDAMGFCTEKRARFSCNYFAPLV
jgi:hypothetical protein